MLKKMVSKFMYWIEERHKIYLRKKSGQPRPWTKDRVLDMYKFCNVFRENDRVTVWIADNWRDPCKDLEDIWFYMAIARFINSTNTLAKLPPPSKNWSASKLENSLTSIRSSGDKVFGGAYIISTSGASRKKVEYVVHDILTPLWNDRRILRPTKNDTLQSFANRLSPYRGMGSFMVGQVVADIKYTPPLLMADDWGTFALMGPGSRRGMNRLLGMDKRKALQYDEWLENLLTLRETVNAKHILPSPIHAQDMQNCLCEFDKYMRAVLGEGRPKQLYKEAPW